MNLFIVSEILNHKVVSNPEFDPRRYVKRDVVRYDQEVHPDNFGILVCDKSGQRVGLGFQITIEYGQVLNIDTDYKWCLDKVSKFYDLPSLYRQGVLLGHFSFVFGDYGSVVTGCVFDTPFSY